MQIDLYHDSVSGEMDGQGGRLLQEAGIALSPSIGVARQPGAAGMGGLNGPKTGAGGSHDESAWETEPVGERPPCVEREEECGRQNKGPQSCSYANPQRL